MTLKWRAFLIIAAMPLAAQAPASYVLRDARVVAVSRPVLERGTVVIRDGLIESIGENIATPPGAWVIDCKGLTVYPGLIDALSTWGMATRGAVISAGPPAKGPEDRPLTSSWIKAADQITPTDRNIQTAREAGFTTAVVFPSGNIFSGQGSVIDLAGDRAGQMVIADSVGQFVTLRTSGGRGFPSSLLGSIAYVRQTYLDADRYQAAKGIYEKNPKGLARPAYDRALEGVLSSPRVLLPAERGVEIERMLSLSKDLNRHVVLYGGHEAWRAADILKQAQTPVLVSLKYPSRLPDADPDVEEPLRILQFREKAPAAAGALAKAGVPFAFYSDGITNPKDTVPAVRKAIEAGLNPDDAIRALTLSPAEIYGVADRIGSIDPGKIANVIVTDGDLFAAKTKLKYIFVDGAKFEPLPEEPARPVGRGTSR